MVLKDKVAVVTGAASGIGRALSMTLAANGARLALADRDESGLEETRRQVTDLAGEVRSYRVDVSDRAAVLAFAEKAQRDFGAIDLLINNAGVSSSGRVEELSYETLEWTLGVNLWGVIHGTKAFLPHLLTRPEAGIVNVSSVYGLMGIPGQAAYCTSKFAVRGFTEALRQELHGTSVSVVLVFPGGVQTNIVKNSRSDLKLRPDELDQGKREFEASLKTTAQAAAATIVEGIRRKRPRVLIGQDAKAMDLLARLMPESYDRSIRKHMQKTGSWQRLQTRPPQG